MHDVMERAELSHKALFSYHRFLFTPRKGRERVTMHLSAEDAAKIKRGKWQAVVTDLDTGRTWKVQGASCGHANGCRCDAIVVKEMS